MSSSALPSSSSRRSRLIGLAALVLAGVAWASLYLVAKPVLREVRPAAFTLIRYTVAALIYALLLAPRGAAPWRQLRRHGGRLALLGALGYGWFGLLMLAGLALSNAAHGATIVATMPISTQLLRWALDGQRPGRLGILSSLLALVGVAVVAGLLGHASELRPAMLLGDLLTLVGSLGWVLYTRGAARLAELDPLAYSGLTAIALWPLLALGVLAAAALGWTELPSATQLREQWQGLLYVGIVPSVIAVLSYMQGVRRLGAVTGTAFLNLIPVSALALGAAFGQQPTAAELLGCAIVVGALLMHSLLPQRAAARQARQAHRPATPRTPSACLR